MVKEEELALLRRIRRGDSHALGRLIAEHRGWVSAMAYSFARAGVSREDLVSEGVVGLLVALQRFDARHGTRFSTYARHWVRANMFQFVARNRRAVAAPQTRVMRKLRLDLGRTERTLQQRCGTAPSDDALAKELSVERDAIALARCVLYVRDVAVAHGDPEPGQHALLEPELPDDRAIRAEEQRRAVDLTAQALRVLSLRERTVVNARILREPPRTLREIGNELGISRERARQIQVNALEKMRSALR